MSTTKEEDMDVPNGNATREEWAAYAKEAGAPDKETKSVDEGGLSRDALRTKYSPPSPTSGKGLKYEGTADVREITKAQWAKAGVDDQELVRWNAENDHTVLETDLSKKALAVLGEDSSFKSVDVEA